MAMSSVILPPVADETPPRSWRVVALSVLGLVVLVTTIAQLSLPPSFDESKAARQWFSADEAMAKVTTLFAQRKFEEAYGVALPHAEAGDPQMQYILGALQANGLFGDYRMDHCKAAVWWDKAARAGDAYSMAMLSELYQHGSGVERSTDLWYFWQRQSLKSITKDMPPARQEELKRKYSFDFDSQLGFGETRPPREELEEKFKAWNYKTSAPLVIAPLPDIPIVDLITEAFFIDGEGCHKPNYQLPELFFRVERK
jgi:hypothetical protein